MADPQECLTCKFCERVTNPNRQPALECHRYPPSVDTHFVPSSVAMAPGKASFQIKKVTEFPQCIGRCGEYQADHTRPVPVINN